MATRVIKTGHHPDYALLIIFTILAVGGLMILASASSEIGKTKFNDTYYYLKHQIYFGASFGIVGFLIGYFVHYQRFRSIAFWLLLFNLGLLILVFTPLGVNSGGASRWIRLGPASFQPAELLKISFILYVAAWLATPKINRAKDFRTGLLPFLIVSGVIAILLVFQPATSTVVILMLAGLTVYFVSGAKIRYIIFTILGGAVALALLIVATPYRLERIIGYLNPNQDNQGTNYHRTQALIAIGSGELTGKGYGASTAKVNYLPAVIDDSIFAVAAQELGFVGSTAIVGLFATLVFRMFWIARKVRDRFGGLVLIGFATIIALQSLINIGAISGLFPLTGVPLPFISYGGTALAVFLTMGGITTNISKYS